MKSMTGFVQEKFENKSMVLYITIKSFNSRTLDIYLKTNLPYAEIEKRAFQTIREYINRGRVECFINILPLKYEQMEIFLNKPALLKILNELKSIGENPNLLFINMAEIPGLISFNPSPFLLENNVINYIENSLKKALEKLIREREREGKETGRIIGKMIDIIERLVEKIEKRESIQKEIINKKIKRNMRIIGRLKKFEDFPKEELFLFLRKMDLAEEIARTKIHINEFKNCVIKNEPVGKKLEFLCLEIQREVTSILSKSEDAKISSLCVEIKNYAEKIKEQLRNIE